MGKYGGRAKLCKFAFCNSPHKMTVQLKIFLWIFAHPNCITYTVTFDVSNGVNTRFMRRLGALGISDSTKSSRSTIWSSSVAKPFAGSTCGCTCMHIYHYIDVIMTTIASQITSLMVVYLTVYSDADQRKHQSSASLAFVWGIHRGPVNSPHKWPVTRKMFPFDDAIMCVYIDVSHPHLRLYIIIFSSRSSSTVA